MLLACQQMCVWRWITTAEFVTHSVSLYSTKIAEGIIISESEMFCGVVGVFYSFETKDLKT